MKHQQPGRDVRATSPSLRAAAVVALLSTACGDSTGPDRDPFFISAVSSPSSAMAIAFGVEVTAVAYDSAFIRFWRTGTTQITRTPATAFGADTVVTAPVLGLNVSATYSLEVNLVKDGRAEAVDTINVATGVLPAWIPAITSIGTDTTPGYLALSLPDGAVIVNNSGRVVWYLASPNGTLNSFQAHANGLYTILGLDDALGTFAVMNVLGDEVGRIGCVGLKTRFHDFRVLADNSYWVMCDETRVMDLTASGGVAQANVTGTVVQHVGADGAVIFQWNPFDHFDITDLNAGERTGDNVNFTHGNGLAPDTDGNIIVSFRSLNEITKINTTTGNVMWRLGGNRNQFNQASDPRAPFTRQHGVRVAGSGRLQFLDNAGNPPSRLVRYSIDTTTMTANLIFQFADGPTIWTSVGGSSQYLTNGHGLVSFGRAGRVVEVDEGGNRAWEIAGLDGTYIFRAQRIKSLYTPGVE